MTPMNVEKIRRFFRYGNTVSENKKQLFKISISRSTYTVKNFDIIAVRFQKIKKILRLVLVEY